MARLPPEYSPSPRVLVPPPPHAEADRPTDAQGTHWTCQRCTNCCQWPGEVRLLPDEPAKIAAFLGLEERTFIEEHTALREDRRGLRLHNRPSGACAMLEGRDCRIQGAKPHQCKGFPNTWNFPGWREVCEAIPMRRTTTGEWRPVRIE